MPKKRKPKAPPPKDEAASFKRFTELTKHIVNVPKSELRNKKRKTHQSRGGASSG